MASSDLELTKNASLPLWQPVPGLLLATAVGTVALILSGHTPSISPLIWAIVLGAVLANLRAVRPSLAPGVAFTSKHLLRLAIGFLGFRLAATQVVAVGPVGMVLVVTAVAGTFLFALWLGRVLRLSWALSSVLAGGVSICGAAAVATVAGTVNAREEDTAVGIGAVTLYGTLSMLVYPLLGTVMGLSADQFGLWAGASIHEVAQVVAAGFAFDSATPTSGSVELATVVKLGRVLTLAPVALVLALAVRKNRGSAKRRVALVPWFILLFVATMTVRSLDIVPMPWIERMMQADTFLLAVAMAALGMDLTWAKVRAAGIRPLLVAGLSTAFISLTTLGLILLLA